MDFLDHTMYNTLVNEKLLLQLVSEKLQRLSKSTSWEDCVLLPRMQVQMEHNRGGLLAREENVGFGKGKNAAKPCGCKRQSKWSVEGWTKGGQVRLHFNSLANASTLRWGWICKGTPFGNGDKVGKISESYRSYSPSQS